MNKKNIDEDKNYSRTRVFTKESAGLNRWQVEDTDTLFHISGGYSKVWKAFQNDIWDY